MNEQPTPETDIEHLQFAMGGFTLDFCRKLERERDSARELAQAFHKDQIILLRERDEARELAETYKEYAQLLGDKINSMATVAHFHGWESTRVEQGKFLREKIKQMEESK